jgi:predicted component of type VI protein secretion system
MLKYRKGKGSDEEEEEVHSTPEQPDLSALEEAIEAIDQTEEDSDWDQAIAEKEQISRSLQFIIDQFDLHFRTRSNCEGVLAGERIEEARPYLTSIDTKIKEWEAKWPQFLGCVC